MLPWHSHDRLELSMAIFVNLSVLLSESFDVHASSAVRAASSCHSPQVHYNLFCGTVLALGNEEQCRSLAKRFNHEIPSNLHFWF